MGLGANILLVERMQNGVPGAVCRGAGAGSLLAAVELAVLLAGGAK